MEVFSSFGPIATLRLDSDGGFATIRFSGDPVNAGAAAQKAVTKHFTPPGVIVEGVVARVAFDDGSTCCFVLLCAALWNWPLGHPR